MVVSAVKLVAILLDAHSNINKHGKNSEIRHSFRYYTLQSSEIFFSLLFITELPSIEFNLHHNFYLVGSY